MKISLFEFCPDCGSRSLKTINNYYQKCTSCNEPHYFNPRPCASAIIIEDNRFLLTLRNISPYKGWWDYPGGFVEPGETPEMCLRRELNEELGIELKNLSFMGFYHDIYKFHNKLLPTLVIYYVCVIKSNRFNMSRDLKDIKWFDIRKPPSRIAFPNGREITKDLIKRFDAGVLG